MTNGSVLEPGQSPLVLVGRAGPNGVARMTLTRPAARNALSLDMLAALTGAFAAIADDPSIRCVILNAEGPAFSAGHDLKELTAARASPDGGRAFFVETMTRCSALMRAIVALPQPVIAAVEDVATAAGCQLVATCDLAIAGERATFATPGVDIGLFCSTPAVALARNVGRKQAMEMLLTGQRIDAAEALRIGLVNRVAPAGGALAAAEALAGLIAAKSASAIKLGKKAFNAQIDLGLAEAYDVASRAMVENMMTNDAREGIGAFIDKRPPNWRHD
jgi:enoyl-CoA hydratase/carnithine racemase